MPGRTVSRVGGAPRNACLRIKLSGGFDQHAMRGNGAYFWESRGDSCGQSQQSSWSPWHSWQQQDSYFWQQPQPAPPQAPGAVRSVGGGAHPPPPVPPPWQNGTAAASEHVFLSPETTSLMQRHERMVEAAARPPAPAQLAPPWQRQQQCRSDSLDLGSPLMPLPAGQPWQRQQQQHQQTPELRLAGDSVDLGTPLQPAAAGGQVQGQHHHSEQRQPSPAASDMDLGTPLPPRHAAPAAPAGAPDAQLKLASMVETVAAEYASLQRQLSRLDVSSSKEADLLPPSPCPPACCPPACPADPAEGVKRQLDALASQLGQLTLCSKEHTGITYLCFDTNVWMDHAGLIRECFKQLKDSGCSSIRILVPLAVLTELDRLKRCLFRGFWARRAIKKLAKCQAEGHPALRGQREDELHRGQLRRNDDGILDCLLLFRARGAQVRFVSKDLQLVVRARNEGFPCCSGEVVRQWLGKQLQEEAAAAKPSRYPVPPQRR
ncbi:hypothetical protein ABPG75_000913 [Micractinium tetrahymenae]